MNTDTHESQQSESPESVANTSDKTRLHTTKRTAEILRVISSIFDITVDIENDPFTDLVEKRSSEYYVRNASARMSEALLSITETMTRQLLEQLDSPPVSQEAQSKLSRLKDAMQDLEMNAVTLREKLVERRKFSFMYDWISDRAEQENDNWIKKWTSTTPPKTKQN